MAKTYDNLGVPVTLSLALHGLAVVAFGVFPSATTVMPIQTTAMTVDLLDTRPAAVIRPHNIRPTAKVKRAAVPKARQKAMKRMSARVRPAATPVAPAMISPPPMALSEAIAASSDASPEAITSSAIALAHAGTFVLPEAGSARSKVRLRHNPRPEYPRMAREAGWAGTVLLQVVVLPNGTVGNVTLYKTSGHTILDEAALSAVRRWHFVPAMEGHVSFESVVSLPIRFDLQDGD